MKKLILLFFVGALLGSFVAQAKVVCASPNTGERSTEAGDINSVCDPTATSETNREVNVGQVVYNVTGQDETTEPATTPTRREGTGQSGSAR